jgi:hypothetical protein
MQSDQLGCMIQNHHLTHKQATLVYNLVFISSLKYGLPLTSLSYVQINKIQKYAIDKFVSAMGIDHSTHRALIYGPSEYGGAWNPPSLYIDFGDEARNNYQPLKG